MKLYTPIALFTAFAATALAAGPVVVEQTVDISAASIASDSADAVTVTAFCPAGTHVTGGGARTNNLDRAFIAATFPSSLTAWTGSATSPTGAGFTLTVTAVCVRN
ncbi:hypothetical protein GGI12_000769 [Dipsacomyces acuminosporus]|nr:hypothetical protein GGI12_000769 [Dipsacomyces acuminosporus]